MRIKHCGDVLGLPAERGRFNSDLCAPFLGAKVISCFLISWKDF